VDFGGDGRHADIVKRPVEFLWAVHTVVTRNFRVGRC
jgi:hypothetical protein